MWWLVGFVFFKGKRKKNISIRTSHVLTNRCVGVLIPKKHSSSILRGIKTLMQIKLQPEGPIPGRKLVRKMTVCACTRRNPACDGAPPLRKKFRALSPPTRCWLCRGAVAISRAGSYTKQIMGIFFDLIFLSGACVRGLCDTTHHQMARCCILST